jgi:hypothetical protein
MKRIGLLKVCFFVVVHSMNFVSLPVWWQKKRYCSNMPNVVSAIDGTSHEIQSSSNEPQQKNILSANQFSSLIDMKRKFINNVEFKNLSTVETLTPKHK